MPTNYDEALRFLILHGSAVDVRRKNPFVVPEPFGLGGFRTQRGARVSPTGRFIWPDPVYQRVSLEHSDAEVIQKLRAALTYGTHIPKLMFPARLPDMREREETYRRAHEARVLLLGWPTQILNLMGVGFRSGSVVWSPSGYNDCLIFDGERWRQVDSSHFSPDPKEIRAQLKRRRQWWPG